MYHKPCEWRFRALLLLLPLVGAASGQGHAPILPSTYWFASATYTEYIAAPVKVYDKQGPSPAFVPKWRRGRGVEVAVGRGVGVHGRLRATGVWDRLPMGYSLDMLIEDHPELGLGYSVQDLNLTRWHRRVCFGLTYEHQWRLGMRGSIRSGAGVLWNAEYKDQSYHSGVGAVRDTTAYWIMGLDARIFPGSSQWQGRGHVRYVHAITPRHAISISYYVDVPFSPAITDGRVVLVGNSPYRTTLRFQQSGLIQGLSAGYEYAWPKWNRRARAERAVRN